MHDANGTALAHGDLVYIPARVIGLSTGTDFCNTSLESVHAMYPGESKTTFSLNAKQVMRVEEAPATIEHDEQLLLSQADGATAESVESIPSPAEGEE
jgi:hypothetical protein